MNHKAVCRTAPATPGLLKSQHTGDTEFLDVCGKEHKYRNIVINLSGKNNNKSLMTVQ